ILRITKSVIKSKSSNPRLLLSSIAGALFAILVLFPQTEFITGAVGKIIFSIILTSLSFKAVTIKDFIKNLAVFYLISFTIGGCGYSLINLFNKSSFSTAKLLLITIFISYLILNISSAVYEKYLRYDTLIHKLTIVINDLQTETHCFYDTGNTLYDPISKLPVIVVNIDVVKNILPHNIIQDIISTNDIVSIYFSYCTNIMLKLIPYHTVSGNGFMLGFKPTEVLIDGKNTDAIIGISTAKVSNDEKYCAIVNPQII
ncbi:MAG: sigma-E processing peptidase SpoIIGA, partial [Clostridia bacterium]|nr:sigma-E processing peptidase SpoIIGA [Clostridia bacterium]